MTKAEQAAYWDKKGRQMVGQRYGRLTVTEYLGIRSIRQNKTCRAVTAVCDCGSEYVYEASRIRGGIVKQCRCCKRKAASRRGCKAPRSTICWDCAKSTNRYLCPWAGGEPRDDWDAEKVARKTVNPQTGQVWMTDGYLVKGCPAFVRG